ncbi:DNA polymerase II subunit B3-1-like isoform X2 [Aristolochia californica]|uniref:DNA polymerase II subunit B3-1-like isoform X2 n=1 Tax=Aristolochia californica TaxID=171875 RepID=UPI0035DC16C3
MKKRKTKAEVVEVKSSSEHEEEEEYDENITAKDHSNGSLSTTTNTIINHRSASQGKTSEECLECFSMPRVRRLMKTQADLRTNRESLFLISATTAMFLQQLVQDAYEEEPRPHKKSASVVSKQKRYEFLSDFVPERLKAKVALSERAALEEEMG